jgi:chemotaxis protein methyltransferase CheR
MDVWEYNYIRREILQLTGVDLQSYKSTQVQRRLAAYLQRSGYATWAGLFNAIRRRAGAATELKHYLTINVSTFFRDAERYAYLRNIVLPELLRQRQVLRVWSAGCARGQEPYTLAMLLSEACGPSQRFRVTATDLDGEALAWARTGGPYSAEDIAGIPVALAQRYLERRRDGAWATTRLRSQIFFRQHDLLKDPFDSAFDLIVCRNVTIYFTGEAKAQLYHRFRGALRPGGVLFVGGTEVIARSHEIGFEMIGNGFYRRVSG